MFDLEQIAKTISTAAIPVIVAITTHEAAHGFVAWRLGDDTAYRAGRVTFNPIKHVDPVGTLLIPAILLLLPGGFLFGYAKPVPVDFYRLRSPRRDMVLVAAAGPAVNVALAVVSALLMHVVPALPDFAEQWALINLQNSVVINLILAVFNMLPVPPLDGGRVAVGLLPMALAAPLARMERVGFVLIAVLLFVLPMIGTQIGMDLNFLGRFILSVVAFLAEGIEKLTGLS